MCLDKTELPPLPEGLDEAAGGVEAASDDSQLRRAWKRSSPLLGSVIRSFAV
jgi:hypothetical protein